jgi:hypothetical protein
VALLEGRVKAAFEVGEYWAKDVQIDVVGLRDDGFTDLGECKWGQVDSKAGLARELEEKIRKFPNRRQATVARRIFTRERGSDVGGSVLWHGLEDLYGPA